MKIFIIVAICLAIFAVLTGAHPQEHHGKHLHRGHGRSSKHSGSSEDHTECGSHTTAPSPVTTSESAVTVASVAITLAP